MEAAPDEVVPYMLPEELPARWSPAITHGGPRRVVVVVDGGVMSAGESFVLEALRSPRVELVGERTAGVHDYQNTRIVAVGRGEYRFLLGYPTLAGHPRFPDGGINRVGIRPSRVFPVGEGEGWGR
jgi:C-terminal processing protease CtpA/Prc